MFYQVDTGESAGLSPQTFDFAYYLGKNMSRTVVHLIEIPPSSFGIMIPIFSALIPIVWMHVDGNPRTLCHTMIFASWMLLFVLGGIWTMTHRIYENTLPVKGLWGVNALAALANSEYSQIGTQDPVSAIEKQPVPRYNNNALLQPSFMYPSLLYGSATNKQLQTWPFWASGPSSCGTWNADVAVLPSGSGGDYHLVFPNDP